MSRISSNSSLGNGMRAAGYALRSAQKKFETASADVSRSTSVSREQQSTQSAPRVSETAQASRASRAAVRTDVGSPPNPGPPGGSNPADLTELMLSQDQAGREIKANVKTLQAFDQMLEEVTRLKRPSE